MLIPLAVASCGDNHGETIIEAPSVEIQNGMLTPEVLEAFGRVSEAVPSPDGKSFVFTLAYESIEENKSNAEIYAANIDGSELKRLTRTSSSESNLRWLDGGTKLAYLGHDKATDKTQIFVSNADGTGAICISQAKNGVSSFEVAPDNKTFVFASDIDANLNADNADNAEVYKGLPKTTGRLVNDLMYKHWDEWVTNYPHPFVAQYDGNQLKDVTDIMDGEPYECPMKPFGGAESFAFTPDGKKLVYVSRKLTGSDYAFSTRSDLYLYDIEAKTTKCLTPDAQGYNTDPAFSPDGKTLAWLSMKTAKFESDKKRLMVMDMASGQVRDLTENWDRWPEGLSWCADSKSIVFNGYSDGTMPIFRINTQTAAIDTVASGVYDYVGVHAMADGRVLALRHSMCVPNDVVVAQNGKVNQVTEINKDLLTRLNMPTVQKEIVPTTDGKEMTTWVVLPPNFDPNKKYPALLYCQGGPQQAVSQFWSWRWNFMIMASHGYIIIAPNRRGVPGFGEEWNAQISGDYPGQNMEDYLAAVDFMKEKPYVDADRLGAMGASYGGFSIYWLAGHHQNRFKALVAHAGIFNMEAQYLETEEMWFADYDMGGAPWDKNNAVAQRTFANSPHQAVNDWTCPILVTVGELDYRILASQGMMAFNAAKMHGLEAEMLVFPDENHWILKPQNAILWQRVFFNFLDKYLKNTKPEYIRKYDPNTPTGPKAGNPAKNAGKPAAAPADSTQNATNK